VSDLRDVFILRISGGQSLEMKWLEEKGANSGMMDTYMVTYNLLPLCVRVVVFLAVNTIAEINFSKCFLKKNFM